MMNEWIMNGIDSIDDSMIVEAMNYKRNRKPIYLAAGAAAAVLLVGTGFLLGTNYMQQYIASYSPPTADGGTSQTNSDMPSGDVLDGDVPDGVPAITTASPTGGTPGLTTEAPTGVGAGDVFNGGDGWGTGELNTALPVLTGDPLTEEEITEYLERYGRDLVQSVLIEDGLPAEAMISTVGFCQVYAYGDRNEVYLTSRFYPIIVNGEVKACLEMFRFNGEIFPQGLFGGSRWDTVNRAFSEHPGETFAFVRCGFLDELMIAQDGTAYQLNYDSGAADRADFDLYSVYATEYNTFNLSEVLENGQYIKVTF